MRRQNAIMHDQHFGLRYIEPQKITTRKVIAKKFWDI